MPTILHSVFIISYHPAYPICNTCHVISWIEPLSEILDNPLFTPNTSHIINHGDYTINQPKIQYHYEKCGIYQFTPVETLALKEYIDDHLHKGYICPSKLPIPSLFFFADKKGSELCSIQDYHALNDIMVKNATPLPLIPKLINKLQEFHYFTKFDV